MICPPCVRAGQLLTVVKDTPDGNPWIPAAIEQVGAMHEVCIAPDTCPCHHQTATDALGGNDCVSTTVTR